WGHVWEHINDQMGYSQTRTLTYMASGGLFGVGLGDGMLAGSGVFAADSDLVFGLLCEEQGLLLGLVVLMAIAMFTIYARSDVTRSRSTFFSIGACAVAGMLLFQTCLNVFGATDILPMTGVTLPFISAGGSSMMSVWGLMAFLKASDERTYAARRASKNSSRPAAARPGRGTGEFAPPRPSRTAERDTGYTPRPAPRRKSGAGKRYASPPARHSSSKRPPPPPGDSGDMEDITSWR
ncbi:MAG: FtsW/RodA/SpoVE family cell cycle protein, partial [Acutalibacter sp.]|nr:FtsW/RodA/SpoVE family cell cycle protein [Acutalibacter sp.]